MDEINQPSDPLPPVEPTPETPVPESPVYLTPAPTVPAAPVAPFYDPTQDERTFATLAHALQMPGWWIAPLIILLTKKESKFVKFHATQALLLQVVHFAVIITTMVIVFAAMFASIGSLAQAGSTIKPEPPVALFVFMPFMWLIMFGMYVLILVLSIMFAIKAGKGNGPIIRCLAT